MATRRCTCGYNVFVDRIDKATSYQSRWRPVATQGGFGAIPFGVNMGGFGTQGWGRFLVQVTRAALQTVCTSCSRVRRSVPVGGGTPMGTWTVGRAVYVLLTDSSARGCLVGCFEGIDVATVFEAMPEKSLEDIPLLGGRPVEAQVTLPSDAVTADTVYRFLLDSDAEPGTYRFVLKDRCLNTAQTLLTLQAAAA